MEDVVHHACLKNILEKLIVDNGPACLDFKNPSFAGGMGVGVETLQYLALAPKKHGDDDLVFGGLPFLDPKSDLFQAWAEPSHNGVRSEEHTSELQSPCNLVCRLLLEKKKNKT